MKIEFRCCTLHLASCILILIPMLALAGIRDTKHNLSVSGPGPIKAVAETQLCIFCHTPHNSYPSGPLWNHDPSAQTNYINYWSETLKAYTYEQAQAYPVDGFSKLCLGCHDGTIALGAVKSRQADIEMVTISGVIEGGRLLSGAAGYLGTDLSGGHPISFVFDEELKNKRNAEGSLMRLKWPIDDPQVKLDSSSKVQCTACHDPHGSMATEGWPPFWNKATYDEVCQVCHEF